MAGNRPYNQPVNPFLPCLAFRKFEYLDLHNLAVKQREAKQRETAQEEVFNNFEVVLSADILKYTSLAD